MPSTTVHFPDDVLRRIDVVASRRGVSRNRFVIAACESALDEDAGAWPGHFFEGELTDEDYLLLQETTRELECAVLDNRRNRGTPLS